MNVTAVIIALAVVVTVSILVVVTIHMREKAIIERARRLKAIEDAFFGAHRVFSELPGQYLGKDMRMMLLARMQDQLSKMQSLDASNNLLKWQEEVNVLLVAVRDDKYEARQDKVDTIDKSRNVRDLLNYLNKIIESQKKAGRLGGDKASRLQKQTAFLIAKSHTDLHITKAREHAQDGELRKAVNAYHMASTEMGKCRDHPTAQKAIKSFRTRIHELEETIRQQTEAAAVKSGMDDEWEKYMQDADWKKKADYD